MNIFWFRPLPAEGILSALALLFACTILNAQVNVLTYHNNLSRTGVNSQETILTTTNVNASSFGKLFVINVDGKVDAQPLYVSSVLVGRRGIHNVLFIATEHDSVYAFDADSGASLWSISMLAPGETTSDDRGCNQVSPEIGATATPVIAPNQGRHGTIYVVAMSKDATHTYRQRLHALDMTTGAEQFGGPVEVQARYPGTGENSSGGYVTFDPKMYKNRPGLLLSNNVVYTMWSSHCDFRPYTGWVMGYSTSTLKQLSVLNLTPNGSQGSIWGSGSAAAADAAGNLYWLMANGTFDTKLTPGGFPAKGDYGNSFLKVSTAGNQLRILDYFAMYNTVSESSSDLDLGSGGAILLPPLLNSQGQPVQLAAGGGKDRNIYIVDTQNMGKFSPSTNHIYQEIRSALTGEIYSQPAFFNNVLYLGAANDHLKAFTFANGRFFSSFTSQTITKFGYPGTTPSISSNGSQNVIVWTAQNNPLAALHAYDGTDLSKELFSSRDAPKGRDNFGNGNKFIVPTVVNGKVYVGTTTGVGVFGLLP